MHRQRQDHLGGDRRGQDGDRAAALAAQLRAVDARSDELKGSEQAIRVGDMAICALPGEPFCQTGLNIRGKSPFKMTMMVGMANDYAGYLPTEEAHGHGGYETWRAKSSFRSRANSWNT